MRNVWILGSNRLRRAFSSFNCLRNADEWASWDKTIDYAHNPPSSWYHSEHAHMRDLASVFGSSWRLAKVHPVPPSTYTTGRMSNVEYLLVADETGTPRGFHNVCRHHAALVAQGEGPASSECTFRCPYHGWTYDVNGRLVKATKLKGIADFKPRDNGLVPIPAERWAHHFTFLNLGDVKERSAQRLSDWIGARCTDMLVAAGVGDSDLVPVANKVYKGIRCNWKVFCDNYLDGGYHVPVAHPRLAAGLDLARYSSTCFENASVQTCLPDADARLGNQQLAYAFIFPNMMVNRYGSWMDVNVVTPTGPNTCDVRFDWWVKEELSSDEGFIAESLRASDLVQQEDIALCESVQRGLESAGFRAGRYAPTLEQPMFHFHRMLHACYRRHEQQASAQTGSV